MQNNRVATGGPRSRLGPAPSARTRWRLARLSAARTRILDVLTDQPEPCTVTALSELTSQHPNTVREHLDGLVGDRLAVRTRAPAQGRGRPAWLYGAGPEAGSDPGAREYAGLASALAAQIARTSLHPGADSIEAGRSWGHDLVRQFPAASTSTSTSALGVGTTKHRSAVTARRQVVALLDELGFAPSTDVRAGVVKLHRCPLLEAAQEYPEVVCGVHLGVVRGALAELGATTEQTEQTALQPFSEPGACRLDLLPGGRKRPETNPT